LLYCCSHWLLIACAIVNNLQCLPAIEAFQGAHQHTGCRARRKIPNFCSVGSTARFPPLVASGTKPMQGTTRLFDKQQDGGDDDDDDDTNGQAAKTEEQVEVGTKEYYDGFLSSPILDETVAERGSGLEQALKLGGGVVLVLIVLVAGFMASNGLL
jgi:hypothetical protein